MLYIISEITVFIQIAKRCVNFVYSHLLMNFKAWFAGIATFSLETMLVDHAIM